MGWWFGRMLTFEVVADDAPVALGALLGDASGGVIQAEAGPSIAGFAAHGSSIRDSLDALVELSGSKLSDENGRLRAAAAGAAVPIGDDELGCALDGASDIRVERQRAPVSARPASIAMTYYDAARDYQAGQARASSGQGGLRDERLELPAVLTASEARHLAESAIARRWQASDRLKLRLPPSRMGMRPGNSIRLNDDARSWVIDSVSIEGMAVVVEADTATATIQGLPSDGGRSVSERDLPVGRSELVLFELPSDGDAPAIAPRIMLAGSNDGLWKTLPVELKLGASHFANMALGRRAVIGRAETVLDPRAPLILDELSTIIVRLANEETVLLNADWDALAEGANLALLGNELLQYGAAERLGDGRFRLSKLLRGRRGTEWAAREHAVGEHFCLIDRGEFAIAELPTSAVGATLSATAHGIGDVAPLPQDIRPVSGEAMRPPSPCHFRVRRTGGNVTADWVRRSHRHWAWVDGTGDVQDGFPEHYRLTVCGPDGEVMFETVNRSIMLEPSQIPAEPGQSVQLRVATKGPAAWSHPATATIII